MGELCFLCETQLKWGPNDGSSHNACIDQYNDRVNNKKCGYCGESQMPGNNTCCYRCANGQGTYKGYSGPS